MRPKPKITTDIRDALQHGPVQLDDDSSNEPVFVLRLGDITNLQALVDDRIRQKLTEADADIAAGDVGDWDVQEIKRRRRARLANDSND